MFEHNKLQSLEEFFFGLDKRKNKGIFFYRIDGYSDGIREFIQRYYEEARKNGVIIEGKIQNPTEQNLSYYQEMLGMEFEMNPDFIKTRLKKWLPRMNDVQCTNVTNAIYRTLQEMEQEGKNMNMMKNAYVKFMCWLYYKFERIVHQLGANSLPKILYEGEVSNYELKLLIVLAYAGCDIVLLEYQGDAAYQKLDAPSKYSELWTEPGLTAFPEQFSLKEMRRQAEQSMKYERLYGVRPQMKACTNAWMDGKGLDDLKIGIYARGKDSRFFYNAFMRINGVEDKTTYVNDLYAFQMEVKAGKRNLVVINQTIQAPTVDEIAKIHRGNYKGIEHLVADLLTNLKYSANIELERLMKQSFIDIILKESQIPEMNLNKLTNKAVYLLCWMQRYQDRLFSNWKMPDISCMVYLGGCRNENEALFMKFVSRLPVDVLILVPDLNQKCCLEDSLLFECNYQESLHVDYFPENSSEIRMGTAAYHAERELDTLMYQDTGMYRNQQYAKANTVSLQTMYEEIAILWDQELKYRPNFSTMNEKVTLPVIFAKVSGVKDGDVSKYWNDVRTLITADTFVITRAPYLLSTTHNPMKAFSTEFYKNGKLQKNRIKSHPQYPYGYLRDEIQEHILDKLQLLIDQKVIKGTFENGMEYTIVATVMNMKKDILRMLQKFDFTKKNPKLIYINTTENVVSLEDAIMLAFLNLVGFDIVIFVPTGYQCFENYFNKKIVEEHQIGEYLYDMQVPNLEGGKGHISLKDRIFRRIQS